MIKTFIKEVRKINRVFETIFLQIKNDYSKLSPIERVVGMKEAAEILDIPERTLRSRMNNGEFDESKGEFRRLATSIVFDIEAIENRKFMKKEIYWELKEKYQNGEIEDIFIAPYSKIDETLQEILKEVKKQK